MTASLCLLHGVLYVGFGERTARVRAFDLDGHELDAGFDFSGPDGARAVVSGLSVDADHRVWVADEASSGLRCFTLFGAEIAHVLPEHGSGRDALGELGTPVDVVSLGSDDEQRLLVASRGARRHAVQVLPLGPAGGRTLSLRPLGDPNARFRGVRRVACHGRLVYACEPLAGRVQVFRDGEFHFPLDLQLAGGERFRPVALAPLPDGRLVVAHAGEKSALLLLDPAGRLLSVLAEDGIEEGAVAEPADLALELAERDARARLGVLDLGGDRVQVFNLEGRCYGSFPSLASPRAPRGS